MAFRYAVIRSKLNGGDGYRGIVVPAGRAGMEDVVERIVEQGSTVGRADILAVLEGFVSAVEFLVLEGRTVTTPAVNYRAAIRGKFQGPTEPFDPACHQLVLCAGPGQRLRRAVRERARLLRHEATVPCPAPQEYTDANSGTRNSTLTPGGIGRLAGCRLKFDPNDPQQGVFFVAADRGARRVETVGRNMPRQLVFLVPALAPGEYALEVRAVMKCSRELRSGALGARLTVR
jgi:hypothetical protein